MLQIEQLKQFFPPFLWDNPAHRKYMLKEYLQLQILEYLTTVKYLRKIVFIGGTNLRVVKGIDRFSEDLDFDCKDLSRDEFIRMTDGIIEFLKRLGFQVETRDKQNNKLTAFRRSIYFPQLLFEMGLSGYKQERFLVKVESEDQQVAYKTKMASIKGCGLYFTFPVPTDDVLCSMKLSAMLSRQKGRDFFDAMFLLSQTMPNFDFLKKKHGIENFNQLKQAVFRVLKTADLEHKAKDFEHLIFQKDNARRILNFKEFIEDLYI